MANKNLLTYGAKLATTEQAYYAPVSVVPPFIDVPLASIYCFLATVDNWTDEQNPPQPTQDQKSLKQLFKNIFAAKYVSSSNISPVIQRNDWTTGVVYDAYQDDVDMFEQDSNGFLTKIFYVKNRYDQIFKCLWNNNGGASTDEPYFEPGSYGTNNIYTAPNDGYKWKFMFTVDTGAKVKFLDSNWIPVPVGQNTPNPIQTSAGAGDIEVINVINGGSGYNPVQAPITVTITGDGTGAVGQAVVENGVITDIRVPTGSSGTNYTHANVSITSASGNGAIAIAPTSPIGGHGFDNPSELGCNHVMFSVEFDGNENGYIPTDIKYHQIGLLINPTTQSLFPAPADGAIYKTTTDFVVAPGFGTFNNSEIVFQGSTLETATFVGTVLSFDEATNVIRILNTTGSPITNSPVFGNDSKTVRTLLSYSTPDFVLFSGYISYIENRTSIQRNADGIEQIKIVLGY